MSVLADALDQRLAEPLAAVHVHDAVVPGLLQNLTGRTLTGLLDGVDQTKTLQLRQNLGIAPLARVDQTDGVLDGEINGHHPPVGTPARKRRRLVACTEVGSEITIGHRVERRKDVLCPVVHHQGLAVLIHDLAVAEPALERLALDERGDGEPRPATGRIIR